MSYQPPPDQGSGSTTPEGGYTPPENTGGTYSTPPASTGGGDYTPPPPAPTGTGGSYTPPPPMAMTTGGGSDDMSHLPQSYMNAVTKPNVGTYEAEIPNASLVKVLIGVTIVAVLTFIFTLLGAGASAAGMSSMFSEFGGAGVDIDPAAVTGGGVVGAIIGLIVTFIAFFIGAGIQFLTAKMLGGQGQDFTTHAYLTSLSYTPLNAISAVVSIIPGIGVIIGLVLTLYRLYLQGLSIQASQRLAPGKAMLAAFMPAIIGLVLGCLSVVACAGLIASILGSANAR